MLWLLACAEPGPPENGEFLEPDWGVEQREEDSAAESDSGDDCPAGTITFEDRDGDGHPGTAVGGCEGAPERTDCDDEDPSVHPDASEADCQERNCDEKPPAAVFEGLAYNDLQDALNMVESGTVSVCPGIWSGGFVLSSPDAAVVLEGATGDPADVLLDGGGTRTVLTAEAGSLTLSGLTFQNGYAEAEVGGGAFVSVAELKLHDVVFQDNAADSRGAGLFAYEFVDALVTDSTFRRNHVEGYGGGARLTARNGRSRLRILDSTFEANTSGYDAAALTLSTRGTADVLISASVFRNNIAGDKVGGVTIDNSGVWDFTIEDSVFQENGAGAFDASFEDSVLVVRNTELSGHTGTAFAVDARRPNDITLDDCRFADNGVAISASVIPPGASHSTVTIQGGALHRNALGIETDRRYIIEAHNVDLGEGVNENDLDVDGCPGSFGPGTSFVYDEKNKIFCE